MAGVVISTAGMVVLVTFIAVETIVLAYLLHRHGYISSKKEKPKVMPKSERDLPIKSRNLGIRLEASGKEVIRRALSTFKEHSADNEAQSYVERPSASTRRSSVGTVITNMWNIGSPKSTKLVKNKWEINAKELKYERIIGAGSCGKVWLAQWHGTPVAVKTFKDAIFDSHDEFMAAVMREISLMSNLHHPNVVMFLGASIQLPELCLLLEYCAYGCMHTFLRNVSIHRSVITLSLCLKFCIDIARGVKYLHERCSIIQRDLKSRNILVDESLNAKLADFGLSRTMRDLEGKDGMTACGTPAWTAPEIITDNGMYTEKVDVYSFGILMWEVLTRQEPYQDNKTGLEGIQIAYAAANSGLRPEIPSFCPDDYRQLMVACWSHEPDDRPNFGVILEKLFAMKKTEHKSNHILQATSRNVEERGNLQGSSNTLRNYDISAPSIHSGIVLSEGTTSNTYVTMTRGQELQGSEESKQQDKSLEPGQTKEERFDGGIGKSQVGETTGDGKKQEDEANALNDRSMEVVEQFENQGERRKVDGIAAATET